MAMNIKSTSARVFFMGALLSAAVAAPPEPFPLKPEAGKSEFDAGRLLRGRLMGTSWKASPVQPLRGGLAPILTFTEETLAPAGYKYEINDANGVTVYFKRGDTQDMQLSPDGKRLTFTFAEKAYAYELLDTAGKLKLQLDGTSWTAVPEQPLRGGLSKVLTFTDDTVGPAGYKYDVNSQDSITIHFLRGDTQLMILSDNGKQLTFIFDGKTYTYERVSR